MLGPIAAFRSIWKDRKGSAAAIMVAMLIPTVAVVGAGIDAGSAYIVKSQLQAGVDAAALSGARAFQITDKSPVSRTGQVDAYFAANFPTGYLGTKNLVMTPKFEVVKNVNITTVTATVDLPTMFMRVVGVDNQKIAAVARAEMQPHPLEVMVVLDNTGSMKDNLPADKNGVVKTRMSALKDASKSFVDILYQGAETRSDLALGFIAYDITVNVGNLLTQWNAASVRQMFGFNDYYMTLLNKKWPNTTYAWKGCVFNDDTVRDVNSTWTYKEPGAWDIDRTLPGEGAHPPVSPYFIPPFWIPKSAFNAVAPNNPANLMTNGNSDYYKVWTGEPGFNLYKLDPAYYDYMLNYDAYDNDFANNPYRRWFYIYFIGLNNGAANMDDDVIVRDNGSNPPSYYDPSTNPWNFTTRTGTPFKIRYEKIPNFGAWKDATEYKINPLGGSTNNGNQNKTEPPSPNWQCPEAATPVAYGRTKTFYKDTVIGQQNGAIYPANGTLHHAGLLWGYRLLVRDDVFKRVNPTLEQPKRALVFMTDGETALGTAQNGGYTDRTWTFYGNFADAPISANVNNLTTQSERRFSKTCASLQAEVNPPTVYIVALTTKDANTLAMFERCAPGHVYRTSDTATLKAAFDDIASELVDLHLTK